MKIGKERKMGREEKGEARDVERRGEIRRGREEIGR